MNAKSIISEARTSEPALLVVSKNSVKIDTMAAGESGGRAVPPWWEKQGQCPGSWAECSRFTFLGMTQLHSTAWRPLSCHCHVPGCRTRCQACHMYQNKIFGFQCDLGQNYQAPQSSTRPGLELMTSRSWQHILCHWDTCSNHLAISVLFFCFFLKEMYCTLF